MTAALRRAESARNRLGNVTRNAANARRTETAIAVTNAIGTRTASATEAAAALGTTTGMTNTRASTGTRATMDAIRKRKSGTGTEIRSTATATGRSERRIKRRRGTRRSASAGRALEHQRRLSGHAACLCTRMMCATSVMWRIRDRTSARKRFVGCYSLKVITYASI